MPLQLFKRYGGGRSPFDAYSRAHGLRGTLHWSERGRLPPSHNSMNLPLLGPWISYLQTTLDESRVMKERRGLDFPGSGRGWHAQVWVHSRAQSWGLDTSCCYHTSLNKLQERPQMRSGQATFPSSLAIITNIWRRGVLTRCCRNARA